MSDPTEEDPPEPVSALPEPEGEAGAEASLVPEAHDHAPAAPEPPAPEPSVAEVPEPPLSKSYASTSPARARGRPTHRSPSPGLFGRVARLVVVLVLVFGLIGPILTVAVYRFLPPPITWLMVERTFQGHGFNRTWRPIDEISPQLTRSVIAAEDAKFCEHHGFDFEAMQKAMAHNERSGKVRGGSTISQQTAKNVFLWPDRDYVRKGLEAYFTVLIEGLWGKRRIMEVYLNSVEWGPGIYGAESAALKNFGVGADRLNPMQAARLAAILPSPLKWQAARPGAYVRKRSGKIGAAAGTVRREGMADCVLD